MKTLWCVVAVACLLIALPPASAGEEEVEAAKLRLEVENLQALVASMQERIQELEALVVELGGSVHPEPEDSEPGTVHEQYDRFTGSRLVRIDSQSITARHKDDPAARIELQAHWVGRQEKGKAPRFSLLVRHREPEQLWTESVEVITLVNATRQRTQVTGRIDQDEEGRYEYVEFDVRGSMLDSFTGAPKVEMRIGEWECVIPGPFRTLIAKQVREMRKAVGTK